METAQWQSRLIWWIDIKELQDLKDILDYSQLRHYSSFLGPPIPLAPLLSSQAPKPLCRLEDQEWTGDIVCREVEEGNKEGSMIFLEVVTFKSW